MLRMTKYESLASLNAELFILKPRALITAQRKAPLFTEGPVTSRCHVVTFVHDASLARAPGKHIMSRLLLHRLFHHNIIPKLPPTHINATALPQAKQYLLEFSISALHR